MLFRNINIMLSVLLTVALATVFVLALTVFGEIREQRFQTASLLTAINQRVGVASEVATYFLKSASKDMLFLQSLLSEEVSGAEWSEVGFKKFMERNEAYTELYLFDENEQCLFNISQDFPDIKRSCENVDSVLQNYEKATQNLTTKEVFLSPMMRYKGASSLVYVMMLQDNRKVIAVVSAEPFLEEVRRLSRSGEVVFLVDQQGRYLAHENRLKEYLAGASDNFYSDFSEAPENVLRNEDAARLDIGQKVFSFWRIDPVESDFALYQGAQHTASNNQNNERWILVAVSEK